MGTITLFFILMMFLVLVIFGFKAIKEKDAEIFLKVPPIVVSLGVLGTFVGIVLGLLNFDVNNIEASIPELLSGLKTAFITSIVGMIISIIIKTFFSLFSESETNPDGSGGLSEAKLFKKMDKITENQNKLIAEITASIKNSKEQSVATFADALKEVIKDFNSKINEQFGDNFKELNDAVKNMLDWQKQYKEDLEFLNNKYESILKSFENWDNKTAKIVQNFEKFGNSIDSYQKVIQIIQDQSGKTNQIMQLIMENRNQTQNSLKDLDALSGQIMTRYDALDSSLNQIITKSQTVFEENNQRLLSFNKEISEKLLSNTKLFEEMINKELNNSFAKFGENFSILLNNFLGDYLSITKKVDTFLAEKESE